MSNAAKNKLEILRSKLPGFEGEPETIKAFVWHQEGQFRAVMNMRGETELWMRTAPGEWYEIGTAEFKGPGFGDAAWGNEELVVPDGAMTELAATIWSAVKRRRQRTPGAWERFEERRP